MRPRPSKIEPGAPQDAKKTAKCDHNRSKMCKIRPRSAPERKMTPTWLQHGVTHFEMGSGSLILWPGWPFPKVLKTSIFYMSIKAYCFDTPGHRQRCGGFNWLRHATDPLKHSKTEPRASKNGRKFGPEPQHGHQEALQTRKSSSRRAQERLGALNPGDMGP